MSSSATPAATGSAPTPRRRNARGDGARLREDIVEAARELLLEAGTDAAVTLRAVARRVGIAAPSIYAHFDSPEQIVQAVVEETYLYLRAHIEQARAQASTPRERLIASCRAYLAYGAEQPALYGLLFTSRRTRPVYESSGQPAELADIGAGVFNLLLQDVRDTVPEGSAESALDIAVELWVAMHGLVVLRATAPGFPWPDAERTELDLITRLARLDVAGDVPGHALR